MALFILYLLVVTLIQDQAQCLHVSLPYGTGFQENERIFHLLRYTLANSKPVFLSIDHSSNGQNTKEDSFEDSLFRTKDDKETFREILAYIHQHKMAEVAKV